MRTSHLLAALFALAAALFSASTARADATADAIRAVTAKIQPSLVIVSFNVERDDGSKVDGRILGSVVGPKNLVMFTGLAINDRVPINQYHDFKVIVPVKANLQTYDAEYLGKDDTAQVAFLRIKDAAAPQLPAIQFDRQAVLDIGDPFVSFVNLGESDGYRIMTQFSRVLGVLDTPFRLYISENMGIPGGPVVALDGRVIGVVGMQSINRGTNAKPNRASTAVIWPTERFIARVEHPPEGGQEVKRPWLGVSALAPVTKELAEHFALGERRGVVVGQVIDESPAAKAGLKAEDIILALDGKDITGTEGQLVEEFQNRLRELKVDQTIALDLFRDGKQQTVKVTLTEQPKTAAEAKRFKNRQFGLTVRELVLADTVARELPNNEKGALVDFIEQGSWAEDGELKVGDIVKKVQDREVDNLDQFQKTFEEEIAKKPKELVLFVLRGKKDTKLLRLEPRWDTLPEAKSDKKPASAAPAEQ
jgi:S1-C subfamily serine protease